MGGEADDLLRWMVAEIPSNRREHYQFSVEAKIVEGLPGILVYSPASGSERRSVPDSLNELLRAGFIHGVPLGEAGSTAGIDAAVVVTRDGLDYAEWLEQQGLKPMILAPAAGQLRLTGHAPSVEIRPAVLFAPAAPPALFESAEHRGALRLALLGVRDETESLELTRAEKVVRDALLLPGIEAAMLALDLGQVAGTIWETARAWFDLTLDRLRSAKAVSMGLAVIAVDGYAGKPLWELADQASQLVRGFLGV